MNNITNSRQLINIQENIQKQHDLLIDITNQLEYNSKSLDTLNNIVWRDTENSLITRLAKVEGVESEIKENQISIKENSTKINQLIWLTLTVLIGVTGYMILRVEKLPSAATAQPSSSIQRHH